MKISHLSFILVAAVSTSFAPSAWAEQPAPIVIPMGHPQAPDDVNLGAFPVPSPAPYSCTMSQDDIRQRVFFALSFVKQGSTAKAQHVLQLLLNDLSN